MKQNLQQITDRLLLNGTLVDNFGLVHGKMGIAVFFFHYARHTGNELYEDYAMELIGEIQAQLHNNSPADYEKGLAGIGVGIDYLIQNNFLHVKENIFEDFDQRIYRAVMYDPWQDCSLYDGLTGYGRYWVCRLRHQPSTRQALEALTQILDLIENNQKMVEKEQTDIYCFLHDLNKTALCSDRTQYLIACYRQLQCLSATESYNLFPRLGDSFIGNLARNQLCSKYFGMPLHEEINLASQQSADKDVDLSMEKMGLLDGFAGEGMYRLTSLTPQADSWLQLL